MATDCAALDVSKIETGEGIVGWGEPVIERHAKSVEAAMHELGEYVIGKDTRPYQRYLADFIPRGLFTAADLY